MLATQALQTCGTCGRLVEAGAGLAAEDKKWYCRPCWDKWYEQQQAAKLTEQLADLHVAPAALPPEEVTAARRVVCKLLGQPLDTQPEYPDEATGGSIPPFVQVTGQGFRWMREGNGAGARWCFEQAVLMRPLDVDAAYHLASFFDVSHLLEETKKWVDRVLELQPDHYNALLMKGIGYERACNNEGAMRCYRQAMDRHGGQATDRLAEVIADLKICLEPEPGWADVAHILAEHPAWYESFPPWQENWIHPVDDPPRLPILSDGCCVWDGVFGEPLLSLLEEVCDSMQLFWQTNGLVAPEGSSVTVWYPWNERAPRNAAEVAAQFLAPLLGEAQEDFAGIEWWAKSRTGNRGMNLHYDESEGDRPWMKCTTCGKEQGLEWLEDHNPWRPKWICLLYLSDTGGPSVGVEQIYRQEGHKVPRVPQRGWAVMPKRGRMVAWRGDLTHGNMAALPDDTELRKIVVFDFWKTHRPPPKHCTDVDFGGTLGVQHLLKSPDECEQSIITEGQRKEKPAPIARTRFSMVHELPHSTRFGFWSFRLPMPTANQLLEGSGLYEMDWRAAAQAYVKGNSSCFGVQNHQPLCGDNGRVTPQTKHEVAKLMGYDLQSAMSAALCRMPLTFELVD